MNIERKRLWRFHKKRLDDEYCPLCFEPIRWIYDGSEDKWSPCDSKPAMYITADNGMKIDMYTQFRKPIKGILYNSWDKRFTKENIKYGFVPHVFTCEVLINEGV